MRMKCRKLGCLLVALFLFVTGLEITQPQKNTSSFCFYEVASESVVPVTIQRATDSQFHTGCVISACEETEERENAK